jgi:hypothetical protein
VVCSAIRHKGYRGTGGFRRKAKYRSGRSLYAFSSLACIKNPENRLADTESATYLNTGEKDYVTVTITSKDSYGGCAFDICIAAGPSFVGALPMRP